MTKKEFIEAIKSTLVNDNDEVIIRNELGEYEPVKSVYFDQYQDVLVIDPIA